MKLLDFWRFKPYKLWTVHHFELSHRAVCAERGDQNYDAVHVCALAIGGYNASAVSDIASKPQGASAQIRCWHVNRPASTKEHRIVQFQESLSRKGCMRKRTSNVRPFLFKLLRSREKEL